MRAKLNLVIVLLLFSCSIKAQVNIQNINVNSDNVSGVLVNAVSVFNYGNEFTASLSIKLFDGRRSQLVAVTTSPVQIRKGLNTFSRMTLSVLSENYANTDNGKYIKTFHTLPTGNFVCCVNLASPSDPEMMDTEEFCEELSVEKDF